MASSYDASAGVRPVRPRAYPVGMAFATERPVAAHPESRAVEDAVRTGPRFEVVSPFEPA